MKYNTDGTGRGEQGQELLQRRRGGTRKEGEGDCREGSSRDEHRNKSPKPGPSTMWQALCNRLQRAVDQYLRQGAEPQTRQGTKAEFACASISPRSVCQGIGLQTRGFKDWCSEVDQNAAL
jgi:hypothetical protein